MEFQKVQQKYYDEIKSTIHSHNHIQSFNHFLNQGIKNLLRDLPAIELLNSEIKNVNESIQVSFEDIKFGEINQIPFQARMTQSSYSVDVFATVKILINKREKHFKNFSMGEIPLMVFSDKCYLKDKRDELENYQEDLHEVGGFFVINGLEKILRNIIIPRKNYPIAVTRSAFTNRQNNFTQFAVMIKSVRNSYLAQTLYLHYTTDDTIYMSIMIKKVEYLFPLALIVKALFDIADLEFVKTFEIKDSNFNPLNLLQNLHSRNLRTQNDCLQYLGFLMRSVFRNYEQGFYSDVEVGKLFLQRYVLIHLEDNWSKVKLFGFMVRKLWKLYNQELVPENLDSLTMQEILTSGQLYGLFYREKLEEVLDFVKFKFQKDMQKQQDQSLPDMICKIFETAPKIGPKMETLLSTGNLKSNTGLDLMQNNGLSIIAERLNNMRYWSHLRSIHRGAYFVEMKTTTVRKLLPDSWGFMCPVHTPDGSLCGLLNHLSLGSTVQCNSIQLSDKIKTKFLRFLSDLGMVQEEFLSRDDQFLEVMFDGEIIGQISQEMAEEFVLKLRKKLKNQNDDQFQDFKTLSICYIPQNNFLKQQRALPGVYLSIAEGRLLRKVFNVKNKFIENIDPFEQTYMMIATNIQDMTTDHSHIEILEDTLLSELAAQIPFMVHNQSPRNMYQCQMAKQTMGTAALNNLERNDNKTYSLNYVQVPVIQNKTMEKLNFNKYPSGLNAVIAILSYTGYDIEDAMIINKSAYQRGFMHGKVYKTSQVDFSQQTIRGKSDAKTLLNQMEKYEESYQKSSRVQNNERIDINQLTSQEQKLDIDGLPQVNAKLSYGDSKMAYYDFNQEQQKFKNYKDKEPSHVERVYISSHKNNLDQINVTMKHHYNRNPVVGDKFSSRHGQKGVLGILWPQIDMPFSENGITPDIIINPNAFPSRMTIGMMIECMAGKTFSLQGKKEFYNSFQRCNFNNVGEFLQQQGYNKMGTEYLYSGIYGVPLKAEIFQGVVYYQRLRHMIKDKAQARNKGPIDCLTRQPIKGRKKGGGIRLGEMERDALIAHGVSYILKERLLNSSDASETIICTSCNSLLSSYEKSDKNTKNKQRICITCDKKGIYKEKKKVIIPYVLKYLVNELAAMNIKMDFNLNQFNFFNFQIITLSSVLIR